MARDKIEIEVLAKGVKDAQKDIEKLKKEIEKTGPATKDTGDSMIGTFTAVAAGAFAAFQTIKQGLDLAKEFARFEQGAKAMESQFGVSANTIIQSLNKVAKGTISNADLIESANRAMALNVTQDVGEMADLLEVARVRGQAMGLDTTQAFNDIVTGIGRGSPLILDNLGIITKGWADEAKAAGKAMDAQFILSKVLADGAEILKKTGDVALTNAERFQQMEVATKNLRLAIGKELLPVFLDVVSGAGDFQNALLGKGTGFGAIIRLVRTLIAGLKIVALQFTTVAKVASISLTPLIKFLQSLGDIKDAFARVKEEGIGAFGAFRDLGKKLVEDTAESIKAQIGAIGSEYAGAFDSVKNIFANIDALVEEQNTKNQERDLQTIADKTLLQETLEQIEADRIKRMEALRKNALAKGIISEREFTWLSLTEIEKRTKAREAAGKAMANIYTDSFKAATDALFDFNKSAKEKLKEVFQAVIDSIATELIARGTALIAASVFPPNPAGWGAGSGMIATASVVKGLASLVKFRQGTEFSPAGTALVGEAGPELVNLPQGSQVIPNNTVNNESIDNRNITINVSSPDAIEFVNSMQSEYGIDIFEGG